MALKREEWDLQRHENDSFICEQRSNCHILKGDFWNVKVCFTSVDY
jgi:hypothetical protein